MLKLWVINLLPSAKLLVFFRLLREMEAFVLLLLRSADPEFCKELASLNKASVSGAELRRDFMVCARHVSLCPLVLQSASTSTPRSTGWIEKR